MKYKVLKTCHAGGRKCIEGTVVEMDKIDNKYLELIKAPKKEAKKDDAPKGQGQTLASLAPKNDLKTGMNAKKDEEKAAEEKAAEEKKAEEDKGKGKGKGKGAGK